MYNVISNPNYNNTGNAENVKILYCDLLVIDGDTND
jgi:hypothetical protein